MKLTADNRRSIVAQKTDGASVRSIALEHGVSRQAIGRILKLSGLFAPPKPAYSLDRSFFSEITDERRAYWLGFLLADGNIARPKSGGGVLRVRLQEKDLPHLKKMAAVLNYDGPVEVKRRFDRFYGRVTTKANIALCSSELCRDLDSIGFSDLKKHGSTSILERVPVSLLRHLVRGLIDGDGSISFQRKDHRHYSVSFCDTHEQVVRWVMSYLSGHVGTNPKKVLQKSKGKCWVVMYGSNGQVRRILDHLYSGCDELSVLSRKSSRYDMIVKDLDARAA